eukprot:6172906-Pleurochrysis_carterae.AAC.1
MHCFPFSTCAACVLAEVSARAQLLRLLVAACAWPSPSASARNSKPPRRSGQPPSPRPLPDSILWYRK